MLPTNHDDRALYVYLHEARNKQAMHYFLRAAWNRIADFVGEKEKTDWETVKRHFKKASALFQLDREEAINPILPVAPWSVFLGYYFRVQEVPLPSPLPEALHDKYFARNALELARLEKDERVYVALESVYKDQLRKAFQRRFKDSTLAFEDVYQEAYLALVERKSDWERRHSAQLYSSLYQIFFKKAVDALRLEDRQNPPPEILEEDGNNSSDFSDRVIDEYLLNVRFGTDDEVEILRKALRELRQECQTLLRLRYYRGLRFREIAEKLGYSTNSMGKRISRCIDGLRNLMFIPKP